jgi:hypothetical protein
VRADTVQHGGNDFRIGAVATRQPMPPQAPDVSGSADRLLRQLGHRVGIGQATGVVDQKRRDFARIEAGEPEVEAVGLKVAKFDAQHVFVPAGRKREGSGAIQVVPS